MPMAMQKKGLSHASAKQYSHSHIAIYDYVYNYVYDYVYGYAYGYAMAMAMPKAQGQGSVHSNRCPFHATSTLHFPASTTTSTTTSSQRILLIDSRLLIISLAVPVTVYNYIQRSMTMLISYATA